MAWSGGERPYITNPHNLQSGRILQFSMSVEIAIVVDEG
jgi:hypothetical protein